MNKVIQKFIYTTSLAFCTVGCVTTDEIARHPILSYTKIDDIDISFELSELPDLHRVQKVDGCHLASFNRNHQELVVFSICSEDEKKTVIKLPQDGPKALGEIDGAFYLNKDSIFLSSDSQLSLKLVDSSLNIINSWDFEENYLPEEFIQKNSNSYYSILVAFLPDIISYPFLYNHQKKSIFFSILCISELSGYEEFKTIYHSPSIVEIPLEQDKSRNFYGEWPASYHKDQIPYNPIVNFTLTPIGNPVINFHYDDYIFDSSTDKFHFAKSNFADSEFSLFNINDQFTNDELEVKTYTLDESYVSIEYDPYQNVYYRLFKRAQNNSNIPGEKPIKTDAEWSIIVLNDDFEIIGEVNFEKEKYNFLKIIPLSSGILIAENRKNLVVEDTVKFDLIKINY